MASVMLTDGSDSQKEFRGGAPTLPTAPTRESTPWNKRKRENRHLRVSRRPLLRPRRGATLSALPLPPAAS